jgi:hypothetical protein
MTPANSIAAHRWREVILGQTALIAGFFIPIRAFTDRTHRSYFARSFRPTAAVQIAQGFRGRPDL